MTRVVKWWLLCCVWIVNNSSTACTPYLPCIIGCLAALSTEAAGQLISSAVAESELARLGLWGPSYRSGAGSLPQGATAPCRAIVTCGLIPELSEEGQLDERKQLPRTAYCWVWQNVYASFAHFCLTTAAAARWGVWRYYTALGRAAGQ